MSDIKITWLYDYYDCETCGCTSAEGARVEIDGAVVLELEPVAHCFDGVTHDRDDVYKMLLQHLGHTLEYDETHSDD